MRTRQSNGAPSPPVGLLVQDWLRVKLSWRVRTTRSSRSLLAMLKHGIAARRGALARCNHTCTLHLARQCGAEWREDFVQ